MDLDGKVSNSLWIIFRVGTDGGITWKTPLVLDAAMREWDPAPRRADIAAAEGNYRTSRLCAYRVELRVCFATVGQLFLKRNSAKPFFKTLSGVF